MISVPEPRYAVSGDVHIAYQTVGEGPDVVFSFGIFSNLDMMWEQPLIARFLERLASFCRLTVFDMRGLGLSDRGAQPPILERQRDDIAAVMDEVGLESAIVFGVARAATMSLLFAATHPERTDALILYSPGVRRLVAEGFSAGRSPEDQDAFRDRFVSEMGTGANLEIQAPSLAGDQHFVKWWARYERSVATPSEYRELAGILTDIDIRGVLGSVHVPTLILSRTGDLVTDAPAQAEYAAEEISAARHVELSGGDHLPFAGDSRALLDEVELFVTGERSPVSTNRVLATICFTDIVDSTSLQASLGDAGWKELIESHHALVRRTLKRHGGTEQDTAGDGFYIRFDGPAQAVAATKEMMSGLEGLGIEIRAGIHTGECEIVDGKCSGLAVSIGARIMAEAGPGEVLVSQTVRDLTVGGGLELEHVGEHVLKGIPESWHLYRVGG